MAKPDYHGENVSLGVNLAMGWDRFFVTLPITYAWSGGPTPVGSATPTLNVVANTVYNLSVTVSNGGGSLVGQAPLLVFTGVKRVGAVVEHPLSVVVGMRCGLDAEVAEHSVRLPASEELDGVFVYTGTEKCSGSARSEGAS